MNRSSTELHTEFTTDRYLRYLEGICMLCAVLLIVVWPLPGTIAARNIALVLGCLSSLAWMYYTKPLLSLQTVLPIVCLLAVPVWLWIHYFFLPTDTAAQLYELKGTWLRVVLGTLMACGLGLMIANRPKLIYGIWFAMTALALVGLLNFLREAWILQQWAIPNYHYPFKGKFALVNFVTYACLFAYTILHISFRERTLVPQTIDSKKLRRFGLFTFFICWLNFLNAQALNGILIASLAGFILLIIFIRLTILDLKKITIKKISFFIFIAFFIGIFIISFWKIDQKNHKKLDTLFEDIQLSMRIDKHSAWQENLGNEQTAKPLNTNGQEVNHSTYSRVAWFVKGVDLLNDNPLGAGFSHLAFRYYMIQEYPYSRTIMTHSGWLDYALGLGLPGLVLTWLAMFLVIKRAYQLTQNTKDVPPLNAYLALWIIGGIWLLWWPAELSEREFIEQLFFIIALFTTAILQPKFINLISSR
jgi:hypothetical protein